VCEQYRSIVAAESEARTQTEVCLDVQWLALNATNPAVEFAVHETHRVWHESALERKDSDHCFDCSGRSHAVTHRCLDGMDRTCFSERPKRDFDTRDFSRIVQGCPCAMCIDESHVLSRNPGSLERSRDRAGRPTPSGIGRREMMCVAGLSHGSEERANRCASTLGFSRTLEYDTSRPFTHRESLSMPIEGTTRLRIHRAQGVKPGIRKPSELISAYRNRDVAVTMT
jgi:hypothetical protein